jgi:hypothetical protein
MKLLSLISLCVLLAACSPEEVTIATVSTDAGGGIACKGNDDCTPNEFCSKQTCGDVVGVCTLRPLLCDNSTAPSCGCTGVAYWNDCLRKQQGDSLREIGECTTAHMTCNGPSDCPSGGFCGRLLIQDHVPCPMNLQGSCWVLPDTCPTPTVTENWKQCGPPFQCHDTCSAIRDGQPHHAEHGPSCP